VGVRWQVEARRKIDERGILRRDPGSEQGKDCKDGN
jgi:hypothetical protein